MIFPIAVAAILAVFAVGWFITKRGRLTFYMLALEGVLIKAEPLYSVVQEHDFSDILTDGQRGWLMFIVAALAALARKRKAIRASTI